MAPKCESVKIIDPMAKEVPRQAYETPVASRQIHKRHSNALSRMWGEFASPAVSRRGGRQRGGLAPPLTNTIVIVIVHFFGFFFIGGGVKSLVTFPGRVW
jgi:hypothetical protein